MDSQINVSIIFSVVTISIVVISEILPFVKSTQANGILHAIVKILTAIKNLKK